MGPQAPSHAWSFKHFAPVVLSPLGSDYQKQSFGRLLCFCSWLATLGLTLWALSASDGSRFVGKPFFEWKFLGVKCPIYWIPFLKLPFEFRF